MLQPTGMAVISQMGLLDEVLARGNRIDRLFGKAGARVVLDVHYAALRRPGMFGIGIHRASLFAILHQAVLKSGMAVHTGRTLAGSTLVGRKRTLHFAGGEPSALYDLVVDALGTRTPLAPPTGRELAYGALWASLDRTQGAAFDPHALAQRYKRASIMAGVMPIGTPPGATTSQLAFFWSLRADRLDVWRAAGLAPWKAQVAALWPDCAPLLDQVHDPDQLTFARYAH